MPRTSGSHSAPVVESGPVVVGSVPVELLLSTLVVADDSPSELLDSPTEPGPLSLESDAALDPSS